jgi:type IV pilus assembly protein PilM
VAIVPRVSRDQGVIGLDLGTTLIKMVEIKSARGALQLAGVAIRPTPPGVIDNGVITDPETLSAALRGMLATLGSRNRRVVSSVASQSSLVVRPIEVPKSSREELSDMMQWEVERHIPFAASEVIMDFQPLVEPEQLPPEAQNMEVLLAVAQEDMINAHVETLEGAGLEPLALDVEPLAASRSLIDVNADQGAYDETIALLNVGAGTSEISVVRRGQLALTRPLPWAGDSLTRAIGETLGHGRDEAERLKREQARIILDGGPEPPTAAAPPPPGAPTGEPAAGAPPTGAEAPAEGGQPETPTGPVFDLSAELGDIPARRQPRQGEPPQPGEPATPPAEPTPPPTEESARTPWSTGSAGPPVPAEADIGVRIFQAIQPALTEMSNEVRRSIDYYNGRSSADPVSRVILFGGTALLPNFDRYLERELSLPVHLAEPLRRVRNVSSQISSAYIEEVGCLLAIAVGLAIRDMISV